MLLFLRTGPMLYHAILSMGPLRKATLILRRLLHHPTLSYPCDELFSLRCEVSSTGSESADSSRARARAPELCDVLRCAEMFNK